MVEWGVSEFKANFFDAAALKKEVSAHTLKNLGGLGSLARTIMQRSIRYRKKSSNPGEPPAAHRASGLSREKTVKGVTKRQQVSPLRELIFFALDPATNSMVVGPVKFGSTGAPRTLEHGGSATIKEPVPAAAKRRATRRQAAAYRKLLREGRLVAPQRAVKTTTINVRPRPFAAPAGQAASVKYRPQK